MAISSQSPKKITYDEIDFDADYDDAKKRPKIRARAKCLRQKIQMARDRKSAASSSGNQLLKRGPLLAITNGEISGAVGYPARAEDLRNDAFVKVS